MSYIYLLHNWLVVEHKLNKFYIKWKSFLTFWNVIYLSKLLNVHNFLHVQSYIYLFILFWFGFLFWSHNNKNSILDSHPNPNGMSLSHIWLFVPNEDHTYFLEKKVSLLCLLLLSLSNSMHIYGAPTYYQFHQRFFYFY